MISPEAQGILFALEGATDWPPEEPVRILAGWCLGMTAPIRAIELRIGAEKLDVGYGIARADIAALHPDIPAASVCGFRVALPLAPGRHDVALVALHDGAPEIELFRRTVDVAFAPLLGNLEAPGTAVPPGRVHVAGWCFHPQARVARVALKIGSATHECTYPMPRPDVRRALAEHPRAGDSGFELRVDLAPGHHDVTIIAELESGATLTLDFPARVRVLSDSAVARAKRALVRRVTALGQIAAVGRTWISRHGHFPRPRDWLRLARKAWRLLGAATPGSMHVLPGGFEVPASADRYDAWLDWNRWTGRRAAWLEARLAASPSLPTISIVMPVCRPDRAGLDRSIESARAQGHKAWELCIATDANGNAALAGHLGALAARDPRIRFAVRAGDSSGATNAAAQLATGDFLLFLDQDDELAPDAIGEIALALAAAPEADVLYSDADKIDVAGRRHAPQFKPDWSPELLLSYMYLSRAFVVRRSLFSDLGGFRDGFEDSQDHDFALRVTERARSIVHVPLVLYHCRATPPSSVSAATAKPATVTGGLVAVDDALLRRGSRGRAVQPEWAERPALGVFSHEFSDDGPRVALLIRVRNPPVVLARCLDSLQKTSYRNYEVVIVPNEDESDKAALGDYLARMPLRVSQVTNPGLRSSSANVYYVAAKTVDAHYLLFLDDNTEVLDPRWLSAMMGYAQLPGVGAVGARLTFADGRVEHAGILHGYNDGLAGPTFMLAPGEDHGYLDYLAVARNYGAVSAACMLTPRQVFVDLGGFNGERFADAYYDADYGFRLEAAGLRCIYAAEARLAHHQSPSGGVPDDPRAAASYRAQHGARIERYYNANLSLANARFDIQPRRAFTAAPPGPVRALMCAFNLNWEGAPYSQFEMTAELKRRRILEPVVYAPVDGPLRAAYEREGIAVHVLPHPLSGVTTGTDYDAALVQFANWVRALAVDVVYGNTLQTFYAIDAAHRIGLPSIWNPRESEPWQDYFRQYPDAVATRALACYGYPYRVVFVAHATAAGSAALDTRHNFTVIHNGLDRRRLVAAAKGMSRDAARGSLGIDPHDIVLLLVGTVCERKGQQDLAQALALLPRNAAARARTFFVGDREGDYQRALHTLVGKLPDERRARVTLVPETDDVARYFLAADVFVCTSRIESYPRVILEAMAWGLPIVTTPVFGIREQVREGVNGVFYEPGDVKTLASAIARLVTDDALRARLAGNAVPALDALTDFESMVTQYGRIFVEAAAP